MCRRCWNAKQPLRMLLYRISLRSGSEYADGCVMCMTKVWRPLVVQDFGSQLKSMATEKTENTEWFAIRSRQESRAESELRLSCEEVFFPKETVSAPGERPREKALIPRVLFVRTAREKVLELEKRAREHPELYVQFWIYRYPADNRIQVIPRDSIDLLRLLTAEDSERCEIFGKTDFREKEHVRITGGIYKGYEGYVQRVKKNKRVLVKIEGICLILLPFIHPEFLERI